MTPKQPALEVGVDAGGCADEAGGLPGTRRHDPPPNLSRTFRNGNFREHCDGHGGYIDDEIESIPQRPGQSPAIALDLLRGTAASAHGIVPVATGTEIYSGHEDEARGKDRRACRSRDPHNSLFDRLAKDFEDTPDRTQEFRRGARRHCGRG